MSNFFIRVPQRILINEVILEQNENKSRSVDVLTNDTIIFPSRIDESTLILNSDGDEFTRTAKIDSIFLSESQYQNALVNNVLYEYQIIGENTSLAVKNNEIVFGVPSANRYKIITYTDSDETYELAGPLLLKFYFDPNNDGGRWQMVQQL